MTQMDFLTNQRQITDREKRLWWPSGRVGGGRTDWEVKIRRCKLVYARWVNNKVLQHSTGNYIQYSVNNIMEKKTIGSAAY